uniref:Uncharacterized protein n=1 Tax=Timema poppense TaxID=170557 RepID=A0A7R9H0E6_TIMPO|nr:unnamed protein product [Timema poppensis]
MAHHTNSEAEAHRPRTSRVKGPEFQELEPHRAANDITRWLLNSMSHRVQPISGPPPRAELTTLVAAVFRLCEVERRAVDVNLIHLLSPEVGSTLMWFLRRWSLSYLLPVERLYSEMSMALLTAFGKDTEGALWTMNFLLGKIESNLRGSCVVKSDCLLNIIKLQSTMEQGALPQVAKRGLFKALVLVGSAVESQARADYWAQCWCFSERSPDGPADARLIRRTDSKLLCPEILLRGEQADAYNYEASSTSFTHPNKLVHTTHAHTQAAVMTACLKFEL